MDDKGSSKSGLSGWAGFQLGRMFSEHQRSSAETAAALLGHRNSPVDMTRMRALIEAQAEENARLHQSLTVYHENYTRLKEWADRAEAELARLRAAEA